ncbi:MAG: hypothetical protein ABIH50_06495 [bacterium]
MKNNEKLKIKNGGIAPRFNLNSLYIHFSFFIFHFSLLLLLASVAIATEKYPAVSGEIYGQAAPGIVAIYANDQPVDFDAQGNFGTDISLKDGEKYLTLRLEYEGLKVIKKYLILRKAKDKTFTVFVSKEKAEEPLEPKPKPVQKKKSKVKYAKKPVKPKTVKKPASSPNVKVCEYLYVWEFSAGKLLLVKEKQGSYSAEIVIPVSKQWLDLKGLTKDELKELINK